jgi:hypothetical protein
VKRFLCDPRENVQWRVDELCACPGGPDQESYSVSIDFSQLTQVQCDSVALVLDMFQFAPGFTDVVRGKGPSERQCNAQICGVELIYSEHKPPFQKGPSHRRAVTLDGLRPFPFCCYECCGN